MLLSGMRLTPEAACAARGTGPHGLRHTQGHACLQDAPFYPSALTTHVSTHTACAQLEGAATPSANPPHTRHLTGPAPSAPPISCCGRG